MFILSLRRYRYPEVVCKKLFWKKIKNSLENPRPATLWKKETPTQWLTLNLMESKQSNPTFGLKYQRKSALRRHLPSFRLDIKPYQAYQATGQSIRILKLGSPKSIGFSGSPMGYHGKVRPELWNFAFWPFYIG